MRNLIITLSLLLFITVSCSSDDSDDACTPIECLNGGIETGDCGCDCPEGYSGTDCSSQVTPSSITILRVNVAKFPNTKLNGDDWDEVAVGSTTRPDLQLDILNASNEIVYSSQALDNRISSGTCDDVNLFYPAFELSGSSITSSLALSLWDEDTSTYDFMGGYTISSGLYSSNNGFPNSIRVGECTSDFVFELDLEYTW